MFAMSNAFFAEVIKSVFEDYEGNIECELRVETLCQRPTHIVLGTTKLTRPFNQDTLPLVLQHQALRRDCDPRL